jgi:outer membrane protein TolC
MRSRSIYRNTAAIAGALLLSACKTFSPDGGMDVPAAIAAQELSKDIMALRTDDDAAAARATVERLLKHTLSAEMAVQIALLNNRGLQAAYNELGIAEATMMAASLPPNPTISVSRIASAAAVEIERKIVANILALATLPARAEIAADRFRQAQLRAAEETVRVAAETRRAYYRAVASQQAVGILTQAKSTAENAAQLAKRLGETGAFNKLEQARQQAFYADVTAQLAAARQRAAGERERLIRPMGLWGGDLAFRLPGALPALPARAHALPAIEREAVRRRIDVQIARLEVEALGKSLGFSQATRFINVLDLGAVAKTTQSADGAVDRQRGIEVELQVPLFDFGETRVRQAEQTYMQAINRLAEIAVNARSQAREAYRAYRSNYDIASHYRREVLPLRKIISDETLLRYNAMQIDVFALLNEARERITANAAAIEAQRDFWLASADLSVAVIGGGLSGTNDAVASGAAMSAMSGGH